MNLGRPPLHGKGDLEQRLTALERYLYRLVQELEAVLEDMEGGQKK